jgi:16S rRNA (guanine527-N7)-methyltransferase
MMRQAVIIFGMISLDSLVSEYTGLQLSPDQMQALDTLQRELLDWNTRINLTAIKEPQQVQIKHLLDSLTCLQVMLGTSMDKVIDVGTGAGLPGFPLKIAQPQMALTLVESIEKKARFCSHMVQVLGLDDVSVISDRVEILGQSPAHRECYDWAIARAVASMPVLAEYLLPLVRLGGHMLAMKGENALEELRSAEKAIQMLGGRLDRWVPVKLPGINETRYLIVIQKIQPTPAAYPRRTGLPAKKPL